MGAQEEQWFLLQRREVEPRSNHLSWVVNRCLPGRDEEKGNQAEGRVCAGTLEGTRSPMCLESRVSRGDKAGEVSMTQTGQEGLTGQADELEFDSVGGGHPREVLQQGYARSS